MRSRLLVMAAVLGAGAGGACKKREGAGPPASAGGGSAGAAGAAPAAAPSPAAPAARVLPADYDPTALVRGGAEALQVYLEEPRHPKWAPAVEKVIGDQLRRDITKVVPETRSVGMGCRTLSCLIIIDVPKEKLELATATALLVTLGPITVNLGLSPEGRAQVLFMTEPRMADADTFTSWYQRTRRKMLDAIRSGSQPNPLPIAVDDLPTD